MTIPDTNAIRVQMRTDANQGYQRLGATTTMHDTILSLCYEIDRLRTKNERLTMERDHFESEVKLRNRIPSMNDHVAGMQAEIERLRAALTPFSEEAAYWLSHNYSRDDRPVEGFQDYTPVMTCGDLFDARAALAACKGVRDAS